MPGCAASGACGYSTKAHQLDGRELAVLLFRRLSLVLALVPRYLPGPLRHSGIAAYTKLDCQYIRTAPGRAPADIQQSHSLLFLHLGRGPNSRAGLSHVPHKLPGRPVGVDTPSSGFAGSLETAIKRSAETTVATASCHMTKVPHLASKKFYSCEVLMLHSVFLNRGMAGDEMEILKSTHIFYYIPSWRKQMMLVLFLSIYRCLFVREIGK